MSEPILKIPHHGTAADMKSKHVEKGARFAKLIGSTPRVGQSSVTVLCACGWKSDHYTWSWAGHGKTKCPRCQNWIDYRTKQVFLDREELEWVKRLRANSGEAPLI